MVQKTELGVPIFVEVPDSLKSVSLIEEDSKRFPDTSGWGYAQFWYAAAASDTFKPFVSDASFGKKVRRCVRGRLAEVARRARGGHLLRLRKNARSREEHGTQRLKPNPFSTAYGMPEGVKVLKAYPDMNRGFSAGPEGVVEKDFIYGTPKGEP